MTPEEEKYEREIFRLSVDFAHVSVHIYKAALERDVISLSKHDALLTVLAYATGQTIVLEEVRKQAVAQGGAS